MSLPRLAPILAWLVALYGLAAFTPPPTLGGSGFIGLAGVDNFGRVTDLNYCALSGGPPGLSLMRFEYTYDASGNRLTCKRTPPPGPVASPTFELQTDTYDPLSRLTSFVVQKKSGANPFVGVRSDAWTLDLLGNWTTRSTTVPTPAVTVEHAVDDQNRLESITTTVTGNSPTSKTFVYDDAGNLSFDGAYAYQYDAWNRLVSVHTAHLSNGSIALDLLVKHHTYDALGRLARTLSPYPSPSQQSGGALRSERFYYDGVRRIVEVQIDTVKSLAGALGSGNQTLVNLANTALALSDGTIDRSEAPAAYEAAEIAATNPTITTARQYIWGPGDGGLDELICQFDASNTVIWPMQDEGGDIIGAADGGGFNGWARLVGAWSYGPYGEVAKAVTPVAHSAIHAGHKGLFVDRLDVGVATPLGTENARLAAGAVHADYARGRHLLPALGRWAQQDPNASGLVLLNSVAMGSGLEASIDGMGLGRLTRDGPSLYEYVGSNPFNRSDPMGRFELLLELDLSSSLREMLATALNRAFLGALGHAAALPFTLVTGAGLAYESGLDAMFSGEASRSGAGDYFDRILDGLTGNSNGPEYDPDYFARNLKELAHRWQVSEEEIGDAIHRLKKGNVAGKLDNPDLDVDWRTGDAFIKGTMEWVGNLKAELGII